MKETQKEHFHRLSFLLGVSAAANVIGWGVFLLFYWSNWIARDGFFYATTWVGILILLLGPFFAVPFVSFRGGSYTVSGYMSAVLNFLLVIFLFLGDNDISSAIWLAIRRIGEPGLPWLALLTVVSLFVWAATEIIMNLARRLKKRSG
jgi:hypothetical protein